MDEREKRIQAIKARMAELEQLDERRGNELERAAKLLEANDQEAKALRAELAELEKAATS